MTNFLLSSDERRQQQRIEYHNLISTGSTFQWQTLF